MSNAGIKFVLCGAAAILFFVFGATGNDHSLAAGLILLAFGCGITTGDRVK